MGILSPNHVDIPQFSIDPSSYNPTPDDLELLKKLTGIDDKELLKNHVLKIQKDAYSVYPYPCIAWFDFITYRISRYPFYNDILKLGRERAGAIYLDLACCFGNDARRLISDGFPIENVIISDLQGDFCEIANSLYHTNAETYPVPFIAGDVFDSAFLSHDKTLLVSSTPPSLKHLDSLTPLRGHASIIHAAWFFHLFSKEQQRDLAHLIASLLSPLPGSMIVGCQLDVQDAEENNEGGLRWSDRGFMAFGHSPTSWKALWEEVFGKGNVVIESSVAEWKSRVARERTPTHKRYEHTWRVMRV